MLGWAILYGEQKAKGKKAPGAECPLTSVERGPGGSCVPLGRGLAGTSGGDHGVGGVQRGEAKRLGETNSPDD